MSSEVKSAAVLLWVCTALDAIAGVALLAASGGDGPDPWVGISALVIAVLTAISAVGLSRGRSWAVPVAVAFRGLDIVTALPGIGAGPGEAIAIAVTVLLSAATIVAVLRTRRLAGALS